MKPMRMLECLKKKLKFGMIGILKEGI
jgi:hypothetical protein